MIKRIVLFLIVFLSFAAEFYANNNFEPGEDTIISDVVVYGGTAAGIMAAIQIARMDKSVVLIEPSSHIGGISVNGLGGTDINNHNFKNGEAVGGLAYEFYQKVGKHYGVENWNENNDNSAVWRFESSVADSIFQNWVDEYEIPVFYNTRLELSKSAIKKEGSEILQIKMENGIKFQAKVFIDATIEADLTHYSGVETIIGRESNDVYGETKNGIRDINTYRQFEVDVNPYNVPGDSLSGVIPTIQEEPFGTPGSGDKRIMAYCFRVCLTQEEGNKVKFTKPDGYDESQYEIYLRYFEAGGNFYRPNSNIPNGKTDLGAWHDLSHNLYGMNHEYPGGDYKTRERILREHQTFTQGLFYFLTNHQDVPEEIQSEWSSWGLCKDEFEDNNNWPRDFYVRSARRMVSDYVITEHHTRRVDPEPVVDPIAVAYWPPDMHHARRIIRNGVAYNEGFVFAGDDWGPFGISYQSITPRIEEANNLIVPSSLSSSYVAYGAIRLEWTYMVIGQSAGIAAAIAVQKGIPVQEVNYSELRNQLLEAKQVLKVDPIE